MDDNNISVIGGDDSDKNKVIKPKPAVSVQEGLTHFFIGATLACVSFAVAYLIISFLIGSEHYIWRAILTLLVSYLFVNAYDEATAKQPTLKAGPVKNFTILFFLIILLNGYNKNSGSDSAGLVNETPAVKNIIIGEQIDFGIVKHVGEIWSTNSTPGKTVVIKIRGAALIVNGESLLPSDYAIKVPSNGIIKVEGTDEITTSIEVVK